MVKTWLKHDSSYLQINVFALILAELLKFRASYYLTTTWLRTQPCAIRLIDAYVKSGTRFAKF